MEFSSLDFLLHTKALLATINYLNQVVPPGPRAPRAQAAAEQPGVSGHTSSGVFHWCICRWVWDVPWQRRLLCSWQCQKKSKMAASSTSSSSPCWAAFTLRCAMTAAALPTSEFKVGTACNGNKDKELRPTWTPTFVTLPPTGIDASVFVQAAQTQVFTRLKDIVVTDSDPTSIHRKVACYTHRHTHKTCTHTCAHSQTCTHIFKNMHRHAFTQEHGHARNQEPEHTCTHAETYCIHMHAHTHTHSRTCTRTHL